MKLLGPFRFDAESGAAETTACAPINAFAFL